MDKQKSDKRKDLKWIKIKDLTSNGLVVKRFIKSGTA